MKLVKNTNPTFKYLTPHWAYAFHSSIDDDDDERWTNAGMMLWLNGWHAQ